MKTLEYIDPVEGFRGWLVYDRTDCRLAAGGCRVVPGLTEDLLRTLAGRMTLKQRLLGSNVDGAKCGIDFDPRSPGKAEAIGRFLSFLKDELQSRFSMGCDMGTEFSELERIGRQQGVPSIKIAIARAQELSVEEYFARIRLLSEPVGMLTLGQRRAGHALAHAAVVAGTTVRPGRRISCAIQGFGNLGRAAAYSLSEAGIQITAVSDEFGFGCDPAGLDIERMVRSPHGTPVPSMVDSRLQGQPPEALFDLPVDMFVLAAGEDSISVAQAGRMQATVVVVGANCGLSPQAESVLFQRGVLVVPDFVGGIGGSASMEALFGATSCPSPAAVLDRVGEIMRRLVERMITEAQADRCPTHLVASRLAATSTVFKDERPYGNSPYLPARALHAVAGIDS